MAYPVFFHTAYTYSYLFNIIFQISMSVHYLFARRFVRTQLVGSHVDATLVTSLILIKLVVQVIYCCLNIVLTLRLVVTTKYYLLVLLNVPLVNNIYPEQTAL